MGREQVFVQVGPEDIDQGLKLTIGMIVTDGIPSPFSDMFLRVRSFRILGGWWQLGIDCDKMH